MEHIKVSKVEEQPTKKGEPFLRLVCEDGVNRNVFDKHLFWAFKSGESEFDVEIKKTGRFENVVAVRGVDVPIEVSSKGKFEQLAEKKTAGITKMVERKENSMAQFACKRDAALFASSNKSKDELLKDYQHWAAYFKKVYHIEEE